MEKDMGKWNVAVTAEGLGIPTMFNEIGESVAGFGANQVTVINTGVSAVYAKINSSVDAVVAATAAGAGAVQLEGSGGRMTWNGVSIKNVVVATAAGESSTITWAAVVVPQ